MKRKAIVALVVILGSILMTAQGGSAKDVSFYAEQEVEKGRDAFNKGNIKVAIQYFNQATVMDPEYAPAYYAIGQANLAQNHLKAAVASFRKAINLAEKPMVKAYIDLGFALTLSGRDNEGLEVYNQALALDPLNKDLHLNLANYYCSQLNSKKAWEHVSFAQKMGAEVSGELLGEMGSLCPQE